MKPEKRTAAPGANGRGRNRDNHMVSNYHTCRVKQAPSRRDPLGDGSPLDRAMAFTFFPNDFAFKKSERTFTLREFKAKVKRTTAEKKSDLPWFKVARFGDKKTDKGSYRSNANLKNFDAIETDYDKGKISIEEACDLFEKAGLSGMCYETPSSAPPNHSFRSVFACSRVMQPNERKALVARIKGLLDESFDDASFTSSQSYRYGGIEGRPAPKVMLFDGGGYIDRAHHLDAGAKGKSGSSNRDLLGDDSPEGVKRHNAEKAFSGDLKRLRECVMAIDPVEHGGYRDWLGVIQAIDHETDGSAEGLELADEWSQGCADYDPQELEEKWDSFGRYGGKRLTGNHLKKISNWSGVSDDEFEDLGPDPDAKPHFVDELNQKHAVVRTGGKTVIADLKPDGVDFGSVSDLHSLYANRRRPNLQGRSVPESELWMQHKKRRTFEGGVDFDPSGKCGPDTLNLWTGFAVKPNPEASCDLIKQHIHRVVAKGNRDHAAYVFGWLAHMVQRPGEKPGVAAVLRGAKGAGKDTVAEVMARIIGRKHCPTVADKNQLTGRFNAHFAAALLLQVQEGVWAGDRQAESPLKSLVTSEWIAIERKGIDVINIKSCMRLIITSNAEWVVPASADERRWAVFEVSDKHCNDREYFDALYAEINGDGPGAFLHYLQNYDLTHFDVRKLPDTDGLLNEKLASLRDFERYWLNALREGRVADSRDWEGGEVTVGRNDLVDDYNQHAKESRFGAEHLDERQIGRALRKLCPGISTKRGKRDSSRRRVYVIPDLDSCRAAFDTFIGREVNWDE